MENDITAIPTEKITGFILELIEQLPQWGKTTTIIVKAGFVFEFKGVFPTGKYDGKYYNLDSAGNGFEGHLPLKNITKLEFQEKKHAGRMAYAICFMDKSNQTVFKVFLGREENGDIIAGQREKFAAIKTVYQQIAS